MRVHGALLRRGPGDAAHGKAAAWRSVVPVVNLEAWGCQNMRPPIHCTYTGRAVSMFSTIRYQSPEKKFEAA